MAEHRPKKPQYERLCRMAADGSCRLSVQGERRAFQELLARAEWLEKERTRLTHKPTRIRT